MKPVYVILIQSDMDVRVHQAFHSREDRDVAFNKLLHKNELGVYYYPSVIKEIK